MKVKGHHFDHAWWMDDTLTVGRVEECLRLPRDMYIKLGEVPLNNPNARIRSEGIVDGDCLVVMRHESPSPPSSPPQPPSQAPRGPATSRHSNKRRSSSTHAQPTSPQTSSSPPSSSTHSPPTFLPPPPEQIPVFIRGHSSATCVVLARCATVGELESLLHLPSDCYLIFHGSALNAKQSIDELGIVKDCTVEVRCRVPGGSGPSDRDAGSGSSSSSGDTDNPGNPVSGGSSDGVSPKFECMFCAKVHDVRLCCCLKDAVFKFSRWSIIAKLYYCQELQNHSDPASGSRRGCAYSVKVETLGKCPTYSIEAEHRMHNQARLAAISPCIGITDDDRFGNLFSQHVGGKLQARDMITHIAVIMRSYPALESLMGEVLHPAKNAMCTPGYQVRCQVQNMQGMPLIEVCTYGDLGVHYTFNENMHSLAHTVHALSASALAHTAQLMLLLTVHTMHTMHTRHTPSASRACMPE